MNLDGMVNVTDVVVVVGMIVGNQARLDDATDATVTIAGNLLSVTAANGFVQGAQIVLSHTNDFSIDLANEYIAEYHTDGNTTTLIVVTDGTSSLENIATIEGDYDIVSSLVVDSKGNEVTTYNEIVQAEFKLNAAYPNPFNPTTSLELVVPTSGYVSIKIYNLVGQEVATLADGFMDANASGYTFQWDASSMASGVYLVRAQAGSNVSTQKLMLIK